MAQTNQLPTKQSTKAGSWLLSMMKSQGGSDSNYADVLYGVVTSVNPIAVQVGNNMPLTDDFVETGRFGVERTVELNGAEVTIKESLSVGDKVSLVRGHGGNRFYIMDRK